MPNKSRIPAPNVLGEVGAKVWHSVAGQYALRPDELLTLEDACAISDMIAALRQAWDDEGRPMTTKGSMGQQVTHPMISEIRTHQAARNALWRQLKLPDDAGTVAGSSDGSTAARKAAAARWSHGA